MWTIYENPSDCPGMFVARKFVGEQPTAEAYAHTDIEVVRDMMRRAGLVCLTRNPSDDPVIVETWL